MNFLLNVIGVVLLPAEVKVSVDKNVFEFVASLVFQLIPFPFVSTNSRNLQWKNIMATEIECRKTYKYFAQFATLPFPHPHPVCLLSLLPMFSSTEPYSKALLRLGAFAELNTLKTELGLGNFSKLGRILEQDILFLVIN